jgi:uncharacterized protein (DUF1330 family)
MAKGYWIGRVDVTNEDVYKKYIAGNGPIFKKFNARPIVRGGPFECVEGAARGRNVVIEFPDLATATACYRSPEYQENMKIRQDSAVADLIIIEGPVGVLTAALAPAKCPQGVTYCAAPAIPLS